MINNPLLQTDFYKLSHVDMMNDNQTLTYSNLTPRSCKHFTARSSIYKDTIVVFGVQVMLIELEKLWREEFFNRALNETLLQYKEVLRESLGITEPNVKHIEELHELGYLPILVKSIEEGTIVPVKTPILTIKNTDKRFAWLVNYLETYISANLWKPMTMATASNEYKQVLKKYNKLTSDSTGGMDFQVHDFAARGLGNSREWSTNSTAHLTSFSGTDTVGAILGAKEYYDAPYSSGMSVPATEHSIMTSAITLIQKEQEVSQLKAEELYLKELITEKYPTGIISVVSDSYDFWGVIETNLPNLKDKVMSRDGKLVIRPDSGTPIDIICGSPVDYDHYLYSIEEFIEIESLEEESVATKLDIYYDYQYEFMRDISSNTGDILVCDEKYYEIQGIDNFLENYGIANTEFSLEGQLSSRQATIEIINKPEVKISKYEQKGLLQSLWNTFGGTVNSKGYKVLDEHIGIIYGDGITVSIYEDILRRMESMGFSSDCLVIGKGAVSDQLITRDSLGFAIKATYIELGEIKNSGQFAGNQDYTETTEMAIFKNPKTDSGKKSLKGLLYVEADSISGVIHTYDEVSKEKENLGLLIPRFKNGKLINKTTLKEIRERLH